MEKDKRLWELPDGIDRLRGKLGLVLMGGAMLSKSLIQFSIDGPGCVQPYLAEIDHSRVSGHSGENPS